MLKNKSEIQSKARAQDAPLFPATEDNPTAPNDRPHPEALLAPPTTPVTENPKPSTSEESTESNSHPALDTPIGDEKDHEGNRPSVLGEISVDQLQVASQAGSLGQRARPRSVVAAPLVVATRRRPAAAPRMLPSIDVTDGDLARLTDEAVRALRTANDPPMVYRYRDGLSRIIREPNGVPLIQPLDHDRLRHRLARVARWLRRTRSGNFRAVAPPMDVVKDLLALPEPPLPVLKHLTFAPYVTASGALHLAPGYQPESQIFYEPNGTLILPRVPPKPTQAQIKAATDVILELFADFSLVGQADRAHAVGLLLLPFGEQLIAGPIPAHAIDKPSAGSGGGLLMDVLLYPALGSVAAKMTEAADNAEWRRIIHAKLIEGSLVIGIDNIQCPLESAALASALTEAVVEDRVIRSTLMRRVAARRIWVFVGINLVMSVEIQRRTILIRLDPGVERPDHRSGFRHPYLRQWVAEHRTEFVHAALTIWQAWLAAGRPLAARTIGSFEAWAQVIGGVLDVASIRGFLENLAIVHRTADPRDVAWRGLIQLWWARIGSGEIGVSDLWKMLDPNEPDLLLALDLGDRGDNARKTQLGLRLNRHRDRVVDGLKLVLARSFQGANRWRLVRI
jgi:putative DNA primase/helicase